MRTQSARLFTFPFLFATCAAGFACSSTNTTPDEDEDAATLTDGGIGDATQSTDTSAPESSSTAETSNTDSPVSGDSTTTVDSAPASVLPALSGYTVSVWATGGTAYKGPDSLELDGTHVWVGYQMGVPTKDGTDAGPPYSSKVVEYNLDGTLAGKSFDIPGHCDGVRVDPTSTCSAPDAGTGCHLVWATSNEDGNPVIMSYDPSTGTTKTYTFAAPVHGGGLDDLAFINGQMIVADSNPSLDTNGNNVFPALSAVHVSGTTATFVPVLMGNATAQDPLADAMVTLNLTDPDSLTIDDKGNLVLVSQADSELVFLKPGTGPDAGLATSVSRLSVGTQLDDTVWATKASGMLLVADATANTIYAVHAPSFVPGTIYTEAPDDSGIVGFVGTVNPGTGAVTPIIIGLKKATGLIFVGQ
jgi:hypothetical protein